MPPVEGLAHHPSSVPAGVRFQNRASTVVYPYVGVRLPLHGFSYRNTGGLFFGVFFFFLPFLTHSAVLLTVFPANHVGFILLQEISYGFANK